MKTDIVYTDDYHLKPEINENRKKLALTSPKSGGRRFGLVLSSQKTKVSIINSNNLMLCREIFAAYCENNAKQVNTSVRYVKIEIA
jgi:hypothetical protein